MSQTLSSMVRKRDRDQLPAPHLTYMIAETLVDTVPITAVRDYGLGERNPETMPGKRSNSETINTNLEYSRQWQAMRKATASIAWIGHKY